MICVTQRSHTEGQSVNYSDMNIIFCTLKNYHTVLCKYVQLVHAKTKEKGEFWPKKCRNGNCFGAVF